MISKTFVFLWIIRICLGLLVPSKREDDRFRFQNDRRTAIQTLIITSSSSLASPLTASATTSTTTSITNESSGLAAKLVKRDPATLRNSLFNVPPAAQVYPPFLRGMWTVESKFRGFLFPSSPTLPKTTVTANALTPGFQKCSVVSVCDVGKEYCTYPMSIDTRTGLEDRAFNLAQMVDANLGYRAVDHVVYDAHTNPNRISVDFIRGSTRNAERIELFCNAREAQWIQQPQQQQEGEEEEELFVCSEYIRQVTFGYSTEFGIARQVNGNYAHFWTWRGRPGGNVLRGNLLTAGYLDPQDSNYLNEPVKPVVVYSQDLSAKRIS